MTGDAFAPLPDEALRGEPIRTNGAIIPAPSEPPKASAIRHNGHGAATQRWVYRAGNGAPLFCTARFDLPGQKKQVLPLCFVGNGWHFQAPHDPRPLYGLDRLAEAPSAPVLVVEGEKAADAALLLFRDMVTVTSQGGCKAARKADWSPLRGRDVVIWPDQDEPGRGYARDVETALRQVGARSARIVDVPKDWPAGWDVADSLPPGVTIERLRQMVEVKARLSFIQAHTLQGVPVQPREWIVQDWLPVGCTTLLYGDGGTGKTLLAQQLMTSCATGKPWCGMAVTQCRSLAIFCEDDEAEIHRRQDRINQTYGVDFEDLEDMTWTSRVGKDNALMRFFADGRQMLTDLLADIKAAALTFQARLIVLDTAADMFGGNENDRAQVRNFLGALNGWAMEMAGAVLINAHPSRSGLSSTGDMDGGSTAWSNTARSRWSLARPKADGESEGGADADERVLTRRKANYASAGDTIKLRWQAGMLAPLNCPTGFTAAAASVNAEGAFLDLLARWTRENRPVSDNVRAGNFAPKMFASSPDRQGFNVRDFSQAMQRLFAAGRIAVRSYGRASDMRHRIEAVAEPGQDHDDNAADHSCGGQI
jgi:RecA-family ATPase